ncbi:response regulator transcription factor [Thermogemmatispora onikobensis]|uniref:response regulator transcription factor n=1 Tax=Thermogemmatispora onikobensis TaxID=732234 RepID=UPI000853D347|nr:response regulator transcription factor [Thermogemmatispora onikobensis]
MADLSSRSRTVLVIEAEAPLRRLIALGLQQKGIMVIATAPQHWPSLSPDWQPGLVIVDLDRRRRQDVSLLQIARIQAQVAGVPIIALSWETPPFSQDEAMLYVRKPFDARFLYALIEEQLSAQAVTAEATIHQASLCPLVTAAGLLLVIIGLLGALVIAGIGLAIALAALLWWTLGQQPHADLLPPRLQPSHPCHV